MGKFYKELENIELVLEKKRRKKTTSKSIVKRKSQTNRKERAKKVEITNYKVSDPRSKGVLSHHTCNAKSVEQSESKKHTCFIEKVNKTGAFKNVSCSCSDFQSRFQYHRNKEGVSKWDGVKPIKQLFDPHTREEPKEMNPDNEGYLCKHLIAFVDVIDNE